jgi:hypothetical protein
MQYTPFMQCLNPRYGPHDSAQGYLYRLWVKELQFAGIDLEKYGKRELEKWEGLPHRPFILDPPLLVHGFVYGSSVSDWQLIVSRNIEITLWKPARPPGAWGSFGFLPRIICWPPRLRESLEDHWIEAETLQIPPKSRFAKEVDEVAWLDRFETSEAGLNTTQDDSTETIRLARALQVSERDPLRKRPSRSTSPLGLRRWRQRYGNDSASGYDYPWDGLGSIMYEKKHQFKRGRIAYEELCWKAGWIVVQEDTFTNYLRRFEDDWYLVRDW